MPYLGEDNLSRQPERITEAVGSNAAIDRANDSGLIFDNYDSTEQAKNLLRCHPDYEADKDKWRKYLDLYESNDIYRYVFKHVRESDAMHEKRVERGYYYNYVASVVELYVSYLYSAPIEREIEDTAGTIKSILMDEFYKDADRAGTNFRVFMQEAAIYAAVEGHVGVLVDSPNEDLSQVSEAARKDEGLYPFVTLFHADQILDWELDDHGNFKWVKLCVKRPQARSWNQPYDDSAVNILIWSEEDWQEWRVYKTNEGTPKAEFVGTGPNTLGVVPFEILRFQRKAKHPWFGVSMVRDIADINIALLNWSSLSDEEIYERCLNILVMQDDGGPDSPIQLSHANVLSYTGENAPEYLVPGATPLEQIRLEKKQAVEEILRLAKLKGPTGMEDVRGATSGIAYAFQFNETNQTLCRKAEALEQLEVKLHKLLSLWLGSKWMGNIEYPREFGVDDLLTELQVLITARTAFTSPTAIREVEKRTARKFFAKASSELVEEIEGEIETEDPKEPTLETAFGMQPPGNSPIDPESDQEEESQQGSDELSVSEE